jgi:hypothetical protein
MRIFYIGWIIILLLSIQEVCAQLLTRSVVSALGLNALESGIYASSTIGESISGTLSNNNTYLTQGFQQPAAVYTIDTSNVNLDAIDIYPNPFIDKINVVVEVKDINNYTIEIFSVQGRRLNSFELNNIFSGSYELNLEDLPSGVYLLQIRTPLFKTNRTFRIIKI